MSKLPHLPLAPLLLGAAVLVVAYLGYTSGRNIVHNYQLRNDETVLRREIETLDRENEQLAAVRDYLQSDEYVEYVARSVLGLVRPGETLVIVSGTDPPPPPADASATPAAGAQRAWWQKLFIDEPDATPAAPPLP
ncbi:MAG: septum formation initiator family protein [Dehalococcoidia bacterium]